MDPLAAFSEPTRAWFRAAFGEPTRIQADAWPLIQAGRSVLAVAPTGSGKTLAAFLWAIDRCASPRARTGVRVLYVSPLKALAVDVERNLRSPLVGIAAEASRLGVPAPQITVAVRSGDTPADERRRMARTPPDVLITTPESLFLLLTSASREILAGVETVIVDEVHAVAGTKRGAHLAVSLARLDHLVGSPVQRIGLSATVRPPEVAARFLVGDGPVSVVEQPGSKEWDLTIQVPVEDMADLSASADPREPSTSIWPHVENRIVDLVNSRRSTIVFANSRRLAERLTARINEIHAEREGALEPDPGKGPPAQVMAQAGASQGALPVLARAHHGSVSKEQRALIEEDLKTGRLRAVVATSSLELGIDMGLVDQVIQVEAPPSVASGLQRVGRAGHQVGAISVGVVLPKYRSDLLGSAVVVDRMRTGGIEALRIPMNPLDVAAQQIVAAVAMDDWPAQELLALLRRTAPFEALTPAVFESVLEMLAGRYPSDAFAELRPRVIWDRETDLVRARPGAQRLAVTSGGTIPDRGLFPVHAVGGGRVGELDEEMVYESRVGDSFSLGATTWQIAEITHDRVTVLPAPGTPGRLPFWHGDSLGRPAELGAAIGAFTRSLVHAEPGAARATLAELGLDGPASANLVAYLDEQAATGHVPTDRTLVVERSRDELGDWRITLLSPFGARVHAPWALVARERLRERFGVDAAVQHSDEGIVARLPDLPDDDWVAEATACMFPDPEDVEREVTRLVGSSALFASRFRECAARALLLPRLQPGRRAPLWQQRQRSAQLLQIAAEHPTFPIVLEAVRECLQDVYDLPALVSLMVAVRERRVRVVESAPSAPSPFARSLLFGYVSEYLYEGDSPLAERRAAALALDPTLLGELLGQTDLRDLLEPEAIAQVVEQVQYLTAERRARGPEDTADHLRVLGPLSTEQAALRGTSPDWLDELEAQRRVFRTRLAGTAVWAAVEDAARLRDGLGAPLPPGLAQAHLEPVGHPIDDLMARFARTHGPFRAEQVSADLGLAPSVVSDWLRRAGAQGRLIEGRFLIGHAGTQWCHPDVLRMIKRRSVALLRHQIEPVDRAALAAFLPRWHHIGAAGGERLRGVDGVLAAIRAFGVQPVPASALEDSILPARVSDYEPGMLDELTASGELTWCATAALPGGDTWVALAPPDSAFLLPRDPQPPEESVARAILEVLAQGGGWSLADLVRRLGSDGYTSPAIAEQLAALMWAGWISNDTLEPVRLMRGARGTRRRHAPAARRGPVRPPRGRYADLSRPRGQLMSGSPGHDVASSPTRGAPGPAALVGRWFALVPDEVPPEVAAVARAQAQLDRLGLVTRGAIANGGDVGGFAASYRTMVAMEERGLVQRVHAVEGLGGAQFALPGVVDRLRLIERELREAGSPPLVLATADPANAYGAALDWPASEWAGTGGSAHRPSRGAGCHVVLVNGRPVLYVERGGRSLLSFAVPDDSTGEGLRPAEAAVLDQAAQALVRAVGSGAVGPLTIRRINGLDALSIEADRVAEVGAALVAAGFHLTPNGYRLRG